MCARNTKNQAVVQRNEPIAENKSLEERNLASEGKRERGDDESKKLDSAQLTKHRRRKRTERRR